MANQKGIFHTYGLFWRRDEIDWHPGSGARDMFRLLGRRGENRPRLQVADFRKQQGIYILYGNHGPYYVGLTRALGLGRRLKDHLHDKHKNEWDRFSWFGFGRVLKGRDIDGLQRIAELAGKQTAMPEKMIGDIEALLIRAMALRNLSKMKFAEAKEWKQVKLHEADHYLGKVRRKKSSPRKVA
jgi:hypothetical protein